MSHLEQWGRDRELETASEALLPIVQASQLLQARKTDEDVNSVCDMCKNLTANQIVKILNLYTPADDYESRVPVSFIKKVQENLKERGENNEQVSVLCKPISSEILSCDTSDTYLRLCPFSFSAFDGSKVRLHGEILVQSIKHSIGRYRDTRGASLAHAQKSITRPRFYSIAFSPTLYFGLVTREYPNSRLVLSKLERERLERENLAISIVWQS